MLVLLLVAMVAVPACVKNGKQTADAASYKDEVVAYVGEEAITMAQLEEKASGGLKKLEQDRYDLLRGVLEELAQEKMVSKAAEARGMSSEDLLRTEVDAKITPPTEDELKEFYEINKHRAQGRSFEEVRTALQRLLGDQKANEVRIAFYNGLKTDLGYRVLLEAPRYDVPIPADAMTKGPADAPVTFVEFADFQCPYCRRAHPVVARLLMEYGDRIRYVFRDYPLGFHARAVPASRAALCASEQDKYWDYYESLKVMTGDLSDNDLEKRAKDVGLDVEAFNSCMASGRFKDYVDQGFADGQALGVTGTPSYFINGRMIVGAKPYEDFKAIIDEEIQLHADASAE
jgi:protein-disulfide isomerase